MGHWITGVVNWRLTGTDGNGTWLSLETRLDTLDKQPQPYQNDSTAFTIQTLADFAQVNFPDWQQGFLRSLVVPYWIDASQDTVSFRSGIYPGVAGIEEVTYANETGLVHYKGKSAGNSTDVISLDLISHTSP